MNRERYLVKVINPETFHAPLSGSARKVFRGFRGRDKKGTALLEARPGTPATVAELGGLKELALDVDSYKKKLLRLLGVKLSDDEHGDKVWKFNAKQVKLVADGNGDMHIVGFYKTMPEGLQRGRSYLLGDVVNVCYEADKPHIQKDEQLYTHDFCESGGEYPRLYYKDGFIFFRGGTYTITPAGIDG
jgi:hypothetical protein